MKIRPLSVVAQPNLMIISFHYFIAALVFGAHALKAPSYFPLFFSFSRKELENGL